MSRPGYAARMILSHRWVLWFFSLSVGDAWADSPWRLSVTWILLSEYLHLKPSPLQQASRKEETHKACEPYSHISSPSDPRKEVETAFFAWFRNTVSRGMKSFPIQNIQISFRELCQKWHCWNVHSVLLSLSTYLWRAPCEQWKTRQCINTKHIFLSRSFHSNGKDAHPRDVIFHARAWSFAFCMGAGSEWLLTGAGGGDPLSLREGCQLNRRCTSASSKLSFHLCVFHINTLLIVVSSTWLGILPTTSYPCSRSLRLQNVRLLSEKAMPSPLRKWMTKKNPYNSLLS